MRSVFLTQSPTDEFVDPLSDYEPIVYGDELQRAMAEESVLSIHSRPYAEVRPDTTVREAVEVLNDLQISSLLIVDEGRLVGIFTERDVLESVAERYLHIADSPVSEFMTSQPIVVYECDPVGAALAAIAVGGYRHVPVLSMSDQVLGIVSPKRVFDFLEARFGS